MTTPQPFKHHDIPKNHLNPDYDSKPSRARDAATIAIRRSMPARSLVLVQEQQAARISYDILNHCQPGKDTAYAAGTLAMAFLNSGYYQAARHANEMRKVSDIPTVVEAELGQQLSVEQFRAKTLGKLAVIADTLGSHTAPKTAALTPSATARRAGRGLTSIGFDLALLQRQSMPTGNEYDVSRQLRDNGQEALAAASQFATDKGLKHPSLAQIADPLSTLVYDWQHEAPNGAFDALQSALTAHQS